jgi:hypothetical protein
MYTSFAVSERINAQVIIWAAAGAIYTAAHYLRNIVELVVILAHMMTFEVSWEPVASAATVAIKSMVLVAVIVGCVVGAVMYPAIVVAVFGVWCALMVSKPKGK